VITGVDKTIKNLQGLAVDIDSAIDDAVLDVAHMVRSTAIKSIQEQSQGRTVRKTTQGGTPISHTVSAEGDAPNTDTGALVKSVAVEHTKGSRVAEVGSDLDYAAHLEFGTVNMAARPFLEPARQAHKRDLEPAINRAVTRQIQQVLA